MTKTTNFVWDPVNDSVLSELDGTGTVQAVYTNEPQQYGSVVSQRRGSISHTLHADALGTTRLLTTAAQASSDTYLYDAWGNLITSTGTTVNPFRWVGRYGYYQDTSTGLVYVRARMYQPTVARWISVDPYSQSDRTHRTHPYIIVENSPTRKLDPSGLVSIDYDCWCSLEYNIAAQCWLWCLGNAFNINEIAAEAQRDGQNAANKEFPDRADPRNRALRHCITSGIIASQAGVKCAWCIGYHREGYQNECQGQDPRSGNQGEVNNSHGRRCSGGYGSTDAVIKCCLKKLENGTLNTDPGGVDD